MKNKYKVTLAICLAVLLAGSFIFDIWHSRDDGRQLKIGFICENDESTPYTYNFMLARTALESEYGDRVSIESQSNVQDEDVADPIQEMVLHGCTLIFTNSYSEHILEQARLYPDVQFCQVSFLPEPAADVPDNYHTFKGSVYEGRYVSGIAAGMKLQEMISLGQITADQALVGFVAAFLTPEVISGFTAFLLGVRAVVPEAVMQVRCTGTWSSYSLEKACARKLIENGCLVISQHTDTIGPAMACQEAAGKLRVWHVGYNQSMLDVAPSHTLISTRINWTPYILSATKAVLEEQDIEQSVDATSVWGHDVCAGFDRGWVEMLELNDVYAAEGTAERVRKEVAEFRRGGKIVFQGNYTGVNPEDPTDTIDLKEGFRENTLSSSPAFHYILDDVITVVNDN